MLVRRQIIASHWKRYSLLKFPPSSDVAHELNEMVLSQGMLDLRSFGYGHRSIQNKRLNSFPEYWIDFFSSSFGLVSYYYGREAGLELREDVETVIEPGMVGCTVTMPLVIKTTQY